MRTRCEKNDIVNSLSGQFTEASCFYIVNMFKINVANMIKLRRDCRKDNASLKIVKTSLIKVALENSKIKNDIVEEIEKISSQQMSGVLFINEKYSTPAKIIKKFKKEFSEGAITLRCAYVDGDLFVGDDKLATLDKLKSKNELIADVVLSLYGGINNVMLSLNSGKNKICGIIETLKKNS